MDMFSACLSWSTKGLLLDKFEEFVKRRRSSLKKSRLLHTIALRSFDEKHSVGTWQNTHGAFDAASVWVFCTNRIGGLHDLSRETTD